MPPVVSIIIPHFNRALLLHETLASLQKQSFADWEAIVVDDGSVPEEWAKAQQFDDSRIRFRQRTDGIKGPSRCRNIGVKESVGRFVMFVDSDDFVAPWCLAERIAFVEANPKAAYCVFPVMLFQKTPGDMVTLWNRLDGDNDLERFLRSDPPWHTSSPMWRRQAIEQLGGFDEEIMYGDDADLHMRALFAAVLNAKASNQLPDLFIRRSLNDRITNTISDRLLDSRMNRLKKGTQLVKAYGTLRQQRLWEGQYIVEAEFLLFNIARSRSRQAQVLKQWKTEWMPSVYYRIVVKTYFVISNHLISHAYLLLRLSRRLAMLALPPAFFPKGGGFEAVEIHSSRLLHMKTALVENR